MYVVSPVHVQRSYAVSAGMYKVHAASRSAGSARTGDDRPLLDLLIMLGDSPSIRQRPGVSGDEPRRRPVFQALHSGPAPTDEDSPSQSAAAIRERSGGFVPNPLDPAARGKPYSPYGRFKELGSDAAAGYLQPMPLTADKQKPWQTRYAAMVRAYNL